MSSIKCMWLLPKEGKKPGKSGKKKSTDMTSDSMLMTCSFPVFRRIVGSGDTEGKRLTNQYPDIK